MISGQVRDFSAFAGDDIGETFSRKGYVILPVENRQGLDEISSLVAATAARYLEAPAPENPQAFLDAVHTNVKLLDSDGRVRADVLNGMRLAVINALRAADWFRPTYYSLARNALADLVGNELAMQRGIGLSAQLPRDDSSLLPIHADVWDGDSPFEVVAWLPLVDCFSTKAMYIVPMEHDRRTQAIMNNGSFDSSETLYQTVSGVAEFLKIDYGHILLFSQTVMHGNRLNEEATTRWSMNCRFKSILSPYSDKRLGEFFEPISMKPATRMGIEYKMPGAFK